MFRVYGLGARFELGSLAAGAACLELSRLLFPTGRMVCCIYM